MSGKQEEFVLRNQKILVTGPASQVGFSIARELARNNQVVGLARFGRAADREKLEKVGVECVRVDLADDDFAAVPSDDD